MVIKGPRKKAEASKAGEGLFDSSHLFGRVRLAASVCQVAVNQWLLHTFFSQATHIEVKATWRIGQCTDPSLGS